MTTFIRLREVKARTSMSKSTIYALAKRDEFPKPVKLGEQASAWVLEEVESWQRERIERRDAR